MFIFKGKEESRTCKKDLYLISGSNEKRAEEDKGLPAERVAQETASLVVPRFREAKVKRIFRKEVKGMGILPVTACVFQKVKNKSSRNLMGVSTQEMRGELSFIWWQP